MLIYDLERGVRAAHTQMSENRVLTRRQLDRWFLVSSSFFEVIFYVKFVFNQNLILRLSFMLMLYSYFFFGICVSCLDTSHLLMRSSSI